MKKLALINTYCNNEEKLLLLRNNLIKLKNLKIDTLIYSPIPLPKETIELADFTIISKENPVLKWPERAMVSWQIIPPLQEPLVVGVPDYGWASLYQYKKLIEFANTLDYDHYFPLIYDIILDDTLIKTLNDPHPKLFFNINKSSIGIANNFFSLSKENAQKFYPLITKDNYYKGSIAESLTKYICNTIGGEISSHYVKDKIDQIHPDEQFNFVPNSFNFKLFITNSHIFKFYFYDLKLDNIDLVLNINGKDIPLTITSENYIFTYEKGFGKNDKVQIKYQNQIIDLSKYYLEDIEIDYWIGDRAATNKK